MIPKKRTRGQDTSRDGIQRSKDIALRLGLGEYEGIDDDGVPTSVQDLRSVFLSTASSVKPELASDLESLLALYKQIPLICYSADKKRRNTRDGGKRYRWSSHCRPRWKYLEHVWQEHLKMLAKGRPVETDLNVKFDDYYDDYRNGVWLSYFNVPPHTDPNIGRIMINLFDWSEKHGLNTPWCRQFAYETLDLWSQSKTYRKARVWWYRTAHVSSVQLGKRNEKLVTLMRTFEPLPQEFVFKRITLFPVQGFRGQEKRLITNQFHRELDAFLDRCEEVARKANLIRSVRKNTREHLRWLADFQIRQVGYDDILAGNEPAKKSSNLARSYLSDDNKTVRQAINQLAKLIKLPIRGEPRRPGRRRATQE